MESRPLRRNYGGLYTVKSRKSIDSVDTWAVKWMLGLALLRVSKNS